MEMFQYLIFLGLMVAVGAQSLKKTSLTACVNDSITLPGNNPSRLMKQSWWKAKYQDGPWIEIGHCVKAKGCTNSTLVLPDGTRAWIGSNGSLMVERTSDQRSATAQFQFLVEDNLKRRHIFKVNFTIYCICTRAGANLNVSKAVEELYPMKDLEEVYLFDDNLTMFAQINSNKTVWVKNESDSPNTAYRNKVTIKQGSLMFHAINQEDNGTTIILEALLNTSSEQTITRLGALSSKTLRIFVCSSSVSEPTGTSQGSTLLYSEHFDYTSSFSTPGRNGQTKSTLSSSTPGLTTKATKRSTDPAWYKEPLGIILIIMIILVVLLLIVVIAILIKTINNRNIDPSSNFPMGVEALPLG